MKYVIFIIVIILGNIAGMVLQKHDITFPSPWLAGYLTGVIALAILQNMD